MLDELGAEGVLDDALGLGEARLQVALAHLVGGHHVVRALDNGRARLERLERIEHAGQRLQVVFDQVRGPLGQRQGLGRDQRQRLAVVADPLAHQDLLVGGEALAPGLARDVGRRAAVGEVGGGQHADHALERACLGRIEAREPRAGRGRAQHLGVQHVGHDVVAGEAGAPLRLTWRVGAHQRLADLAQVDVRRPGPVLGRAGHAWLSPWRSTAAASRTASKTLV